MRSARDLLLGPARNPRPLEDLLRRRVGAREEEGVVVDPFDEVVRPRQVPLRDRDPEALEVVRQRPERPEARGERSLCGKLEVVEEEGS